MSLNLNRSLVKCLIDTLVAIEFANDVKISDDMAVELLEQISADLQTLTPKDRNTIINEITHLSLTYPNEIRDFVKNLPENLGIAEI